MRAARRASTAALCACAVALAGACASTSRRPAQPQPACAAGDSLPGVTSRALAWNGSGFGAVVSDGAGVFLREFDASGAARGERVALTEEPSAPARAGLAWGDGHWYVAVAPRAGAGLRVFRAAPGGAVGDGFALDDAVTGELAMVPRPGASKPAALVANVGDGVGLRLVARDGEPSSARRCPDDVIPRTVTAWGDGFRALAARAEAGTGEARALDLVALDDDCDPVWRTRLWDGTLDGNAHSLAVDDEGAVAAFGDREGAAWIAAVDHQGRLRLRALRVERHARAPQVFVHVDAQGRRGAMQVVAVRNTEVGDALARFRLGADGILQGTQTLVTSPALELLGSAPDPWGGALVAFTREETTHGSARTGAGAYGFFVRVCP